ncbi:MAG: hypothetical protein R6V33_03345 [Pelovirga sp.]
MQRLRALTGGSGLSAMDGCHHGRGLRTAQRGAIRSLGRGIQGPGLNGYNDLFHS